LKSAFTYPGGKTYIADWIIDHFPQHHAYVEVFGGSASVLLQKPKSCVEVYNDVDGDIVNFFNVVRNNADELQEWCEQVPFAREMHDRWGKKWYDGWRPADDIVRAGVFYFLRRSQYAGKYRTFSGFASAATRNKAAQWHDDAQKIDDLKERLKHVQIENRDFQELITRLDGDDVLFYCDPPYLQEGDGLYNHGTFQHERFAEILRSTEGNWIVSYRDVPESLERYHVVERTVAQMMNTTHNDRNERDTERLVMNFDPDTVLRMTESKQQSLESF